MKDKIVIKVDEDTEMLKISGIPGYNGMGNYWDFNTLDWVSIIKELGEKHDFPVEVKFCKIKV